MKYPTAEIQPHGKTVSELREEYIEQLIVASIQLMSWNRKEVLYRILKIDDTLDEIENQLRDAGVKL